MAMAYGSLVLVALLVAGHAALASAATYTVGDSQGWTTGFNYNTWASSKRIAIGDSLVFNYAPKTHSVTEVSQGGYDSCNGANAISDDENGSTTITLSSPGMHYFICNIPGHCANGMKLAVSVSATASGGTPTGAAGGALVPAVGAVLAAAAGAAVKLALF